MNDFTKEMLKDLLKCIHLAEIDHGKSQRMDYLKRKLQFMIDNPDKYKFTAPDDMDSSALAWKYQNE